MEHKNAEKEKIKIENMPILCPIKKISAEYCVKYKCMAYIPPELYYNYDIPVGEDNMLDYSKKTLSWHVKKGNCKLMQN